MKVTWAREKPGGYEVSTAGDRRFSALVATLPDGRTIEMWYQCDIKGYQPGGRDWRKGKGKPSLIEYRGNAQYEAYLLLWKMWACLNPELIGELRKQAAKHLLTLTDRFARSPINQARALADILNEALDEGLSR